MKRALGVLSFLFLLLLAIPVAQAQDTLTQTYTAADGSFSIMYPTGWKADDTYSNGGFTQFNSGPSIVMNQAMEPLKSGDMGVALFIIPNAFLEQEGISGATIHDYVSSMSTNLGESNPKTEDLTIGTYTAARVVMGYFDKDSEIIGVDFGNGKMVAALGITFKGELAALDKTLLPMLESIQVPTNGSPSSSITEAANSATAESTESSAETTAVATEEQPPLFTSTANANIVSARIPDNWSAHSYPSDNQAEIALLEEGPNNLTGEIDFPPVRNGKSPHEIATYPTSYVDGKVTDIEINGRPAARLDGTSNGSTVLYIVVTTSKGDFVLVSFGGPADAMAQEEATMLAIAASIITGNPNAPQVTAPVPTATAISPEATAASTEAPATTIQSVLPVVNGTPRIVFPSEDRGYSDLFTADDNGQNVTQLTQQQLHALLPAWSPDGTMIAYISDTATTSPDAYDVFVIPSSGGEPRKVSSVSSPDRGAIAWSPDSKQLIYLSTRDGGNGAQIYKVNADGSGEQKLTIDAQAINDFTLDWSPDGQHIAFVGFPNGGSDYAILLANPDGSNLTPIPNVSIVQVGEYFKWSPDGQHAVIDDTESLTVTAGDGSAPKVIVDPSANLNIGGVSWSPDGTQIAFTASGSDGTSFLYTINTDGSNQQKIDLGNQEIIWGGLSWGILPSNGSEAPPAAAPTTAASTSSSAACTVTAARSANLRSGPGTTFARAGALAAGGSQSVSGQAKGSDGFVWWKLDNGSWVRSDLVQTAGDCTSVPTVSS